ncbi:MAG: amidase [Pseudomonadales bacterium]|nr:amidase [Pseudomonadales bacterium]
MRFDEYRQYDAVGLAQLIQGGELTAAEVTEAAIQRAEQVNPKINAVITPFYDVARQQAARYRPQEQPLGGVPVLLKDLLGDVQGYRTGHGSKVYCREPVAKSTSELFRRYRDMGMIFLGRTNTPELGLLATTEPVANGATRNPWHLKYSAGGSSGGSAAAVAAGIVPLASAGDGGGSIRLPAACCGVFGFKPSRGLSPMGPLPESWDGAVVEHVITRSVRDSLLVLRHCAGADRWSQYPLSATEDLFRQAETALDKPLRIAVTSQSFYGGDTAPECRAALQASVQLLQQMGHQVEDISLPLDGDKLLACYADIYVANVNADMGPLVRRYGQRFVRSHLEPLTYLIYQVGRQFSAGDYILSRRHWAGFSALMAEFHSRYDLLMTPTMAVPPFKIGDMNPSRLELTLMRVCNHLGLSRFVPRRSLYAMSQPQLQKVPFTQLANITGQPAMSVPLHWTADGMPVGVQFIAGRLQDGLLFRLALALEQARPWWHKVPEIDT